jgi:hypothetical protein
MKNIIFTLITLMLVTGCNSQPVRYQSEEEFSQAKNILIAGEIDNTKMYIKDMPYEELQESLRSSNKHNVESVIEVSLAGAKYSGLMTVTPGISDFAGGSMMLLNSLVKSTYEPVRNTGHIIWMPKTYAKDADEAQQKIEKMLKDAYLESLPEGYSYEELTMTHTPSHGDPKDYDIINIDGDVCSEDGFVCRLRVVSEEPQMDYPTPKWMKETKSYFWTFGKQKPGANAFVSKSKREKVLPSPVWKYFYTDEYFRSVSSRLPEWVYIYSPVARDRNFPAVYNQGDILYFIGPINDDNLTSANNNN